MERNVCGADRRLRLAIGSILAVVALIARRRREPPGRDGAVARWQLLALYAGAELLVTGLLQWCPLNHALGINSCERSWWRGFEEWLRS